MSVFNETSEPRGPGMKLLVMLVLLLAAGAGLFYVSRRHPDPPHSPRGCPFQAWSLGELLRILNGPLAIRRGAREPRNGRAPAPVAIPVL